MELDKRILPGKRPLGCFDTEAAKEFIGKEGYFCRAEYLFSDAKKIGSTSVLAQIKPKEQEPFVPQIAIDRDQSFAYEYFLPAEWLKPEEPETKWRPFKDHNEYKEFLNDGIIEDWVKIKNKITNEIYELMYVGGGGDKILLGGIAFTVGNLFEGFELFNECAQEWLPFGVEGEEE